MGLNHSGRFDPPNARRSNKPIKQINLIIRAIMTISMANVPLD
jgi:hypothetical protein